MHFYLFEKALSKEGTIFVCSYGGVVLLESSMLLFDSDLRSTT